MATMSLSHNGAHTPVPLGSYMATLITERRDNNVTAIHRKLIDTTVTTQHTLGSLANGLTTLLNVPGTVIDLVITPK